MSHIPLFSLPRLKHRIRVESSNEVNEYHWRDEFLYTLCKNLNDWIYVANVTASDSIFAWDIYFYNCMCTFAFGSKKKLVTLRAFRYEINTWPISFYFSMQKYINTWTYHCWISMWSFCISNIFKVYVWSLQKKSFSLYTNSVSVVLCMEGKPTSFGIKLFTIPYNGIYFVLVYFVCVMDASWIWSYWNK